MFSKDCTRKDVRRKTTVRPVVNCAGFVLARHFEQISVIRGLMFN